MIEIQNIDINLLKIDLNNVRYHNRKNIDSIKKSLIEFNQYKPLIIDQNNQILVGKGTYLAMKQLNYKNISVIRKELTQQEKAELMVLDNRTSELSEMNNKIVEQIFYDLDQEKIKLTAFSKNQVQKIMNEISEKELDDQTEKINEFQIICPYCQNKFSVKQEKQ